MTPSELAARFELDSVASIRAMRDLGNINTDAYDVSGQWQGVPGEFILQRLNTDVFPEPDRVMEGATAWLRAQEAATAAGMVPEGLSWVGFSFVATRAGPLLYRESATRVWRMMTRVPKATAFKHLLAVPEGRRRGVVGDVGRALAFFATLGRCAEVTALRPSLPGYRDSVGYYAQLRAVLAEATTEEDAQPFHVPMTQELRRATSRLYRLACSPAESRRRREDPTVARCIADVLDDETTALFVRHRVDQGAFSRTLIHGDPKLENFLFDSASHRIKSAIDLDTVMPLHWLADWGDAVRSLTNPAGEKETDLATIAFDEAVYQDLRAGFLGANPALPGEEIAAMPAAALAQILEQCVRFLADYLRGDSYYRLGPSDPPDLNRTRALVQWRLYGEAKRAIGQGALRSM